MADLATAAVLIIGNEILSGRTQDSNLQFIGQQLAALGIRLTEARIVRDDEEAIISAVRALAARYTYVFTTGGIGPTHDDITALALAKAFGRRLVRDREAERRLRRHYGDAGVNAARLKMADVPEGAELLDNPVSAAPGFRVDNVFVLPGVPMIMRAMFDLLKPRLTGGAPIVSRAIAVMTTESAIAAPLGEVQARHPRVEIGSYPFIRSGRFGVSLVTRGDDAAAVDRAVEGLLEMLRAAGLEPVDDDARSAG